MHGECKVGSVAMCTVHMDTNTRYTPAGGEDYSVINIGRQVFRYDLRFCCWLFLLVLLLVVVLVARCWV